jgi:hypothetical protein
MKKTVLLLCLLLLTTLLSFSKIAPKVDTRVELLSIVFRLAGNYEYNTNLAKGYVTSIHQHFDPYKTDALIEYAKKLREENHIGYDAVMSMAIHLQFSNGRFSLIPESRNNLDSRWTATSAGKFVTLLNAFYRKAQCRQFFEDHKKEYAIVENRFDTVMQGFDQNWYPEYYGIVSTTDFNIIISYGNGGNFGVQVNPLHSSVKIYAIMGAWTMDSIGSPVFNPIDYLPTLIHEFNHSYINYLLDLGDNSAKIQASAALITDSLKEQMAVQAYTDWQTVINESLVRASVIRYMINHQMADSLVQAEMKEQELGRAFLWTPNLVALLGEYESSRTQYPVFSSFYPRIITFFEETAGLIPQMKADYIAHQPVLIAIAPFSNNAENVDATITDIILYFSEPLQGQGSFGRGPRGKEYMPELKKLIGYGDTNKSFHLSVGLQPGKEYEFRVLGRAFKSVSGYPLKDETIKFKTR